jgi:hypothetical protein
MNYLLDYFEDLEFEHVNDERHWLHFEQIRILENTKQIQEENKRLRLENEKLTNKRKLMDMKAAEIDALGTKEQIQNDPELLKRARAIFKQMIEIKNS